MSHPDHSLSISEFDYTRITINGLKFPKNKLIQIIRNF
jgi:hypothetical protein